MIIMMMMVVLKSKIRRILTGIVIKKKLSST